MLIGETIALFVAVAWTATALFAEVGSKRMGSLPLNVVRMSMSLILLAITMWLTMGAPWPRFADRSTWFWLLMSGVVGYVVGDYCLMQGYIYIGSRFGQLFMTLSAPTAAIAGRLLLGEQMRPLAIAGMVITLTGIAISILSKKESTVSLSLPPKGIFYAVMAGLCQGLGLVLSKMGLQHYDAALAAAGLDTAAPVAGALLPLPLYICVPFAATMIRALIGLAGFATLLLVFAHNGRQRLNHAIHDRKAMWCVLGSTVFGPFIGVSASLLATQYTSTGIAQTLFALTPVLIIAPAALLFHQKVAPREVLGAIISVAGVALFFV
ncbi:MAG: DMT family transporter [Bacteroidales bacterium]|nr:DMT family transporter [Bacteroidales bacterium]